MASELERRERAFGHALIVCAKQEADGYGTMTTARTLYDAGHAFAASEIARETQALTEELARCRGQLEAYEKMMAIDQVTLDFGDFMMRGTIGKWKIASDWGDWGPEWSEDVYGSVLEAYEALKQEKQNDE